MSDPKTAPRADLVLRERAAYTVLLGGVVGLAVLLTTDLGFGTQDASSLLGLGALPYAIAAVVTGLCRRSWAAVSFLLGTWLLITVGALLFLVRYTVVEERSGFLSELIYIVPPVVQAPVVLIAAVVAAVLYRRDPMRNPTHV